MKFKNATISFRIWYLVITITLDPPQIEFEWEAVKLKAGPYRLVLARDEEPEDPPDDDDGEAVEPDKAKPKPRKPRKVKEAAK